MGKKTTYTDKCLNGTGLEMGMSAFFSQGYPENKTKNLNFVVNKVRENHPKSFLVISRQEHDKIGPLNFSELQSISFRGHSTSFPETFIVLA